MSMLLSALAALAVALPLAAQNLNGRVFDSHMTAIAGALVRVTGQGFEQTVNADDEGIFGVSLPRAGTYMIATSATGYQSLIRNVVVTDAGYFYTSILRPVPGKEDELVIQTIADPAGLRPGYLPGSEIAVGSVLNLDGSFPGDLTGLRLTATSKADPAIVVEFPVTAATPGRITAVAPLEITPGGYLMTAALAGLGAGRSREAQVNIVRGRPVIYTATGLASSLVLGSHPDGSAITFLNPARPSGEINLLVGNLGIDLRDGSYLVRIGSQQFAVEAGRWSPVGEVPGAAILRLLVPNDTGLGCAVPISLVPPPDRPGLPGVFSSLPISADGPCSDGLGFGNPDWPALTGAGIVNLETLVSEGTLLSAGPQRDLLFARVAATRWTESRYNPPAPAGACSYRWEPAGFVNPVAPERLALSGAASLSIPCCQFNFTQTSNNGPFSLAFSPAPAYIAGNYTLNYSSTFAAGGAPLAAQFTGTYTRLAGQVKSQVVERLRMSPMNYIDEIVAGIIGAQDTLTTDQRNSVWTDFNILGEDGAGGRHFARCVFDPSQSPEREIARLSSQFPRQLNSLDLTVRWFPRNFLRHNHAEGPDRSHLTFDAFVTFQGLRGFSQIAP